MSKQSASHADLDERTVSVDLLSDNAYAYTAEGDPDTGIAVGDGAVTITGWCQGDGHRVGFGAVTGRVLPARIGRVAGP